MLGRASTAWGALQQGLKHVYQESVYMFFTMFTNVYQFCLVHLNGVYQATCTKVDSSWLH